MKTEKISYRKLVDIICCIVVLKLPVFKTQFKVLLIFLLLFSFTQGQISRISGYVYSSETGDPLPGANVILQGTFLGAATDLDGFFKIESIPYGSYKVEVLVIGYRSAEKDVELLPGEHEHIDFYLKSKALRSPEIIVTGAKRAIRKMDSPVSISAISDEQIKIRNPSSLEDILPYEPGVQIVEGQINIRGSSGYARGAGSRVIVLVDGTPAISYDSGVIYWEALPVHNVERVEILRGPESALYGSNAIGGVVNIITKKISERNRTRVIFNGGILSKPNDKEKIWTDNHMLSNDWRISHKRHIGRIGVLAGFGQSSSTGHYQNGWYRRSIFDAKLEYPVSQNRQVTSRLYYIHDKHGTFTQWRSAVQPFHTPENSIDDRIFSDKFQCSSIYTHIVSPKQSRIVRLNYFYTGFQNDIHNNDTFSKSHAFSSEWQVNILPNVIHYITCGLEIKGSNVLADIWGNHYGLDAALYFQDEWKILNSMSLTSGLRWDIHKIDDMKVESQFNPKFGILVHPDENIALRASVGWAYRVPAIAEMFTETQQYIFEIKPNPSLRSETSFSGEMGIFWQTSFINFDMAIFSSHYNRLIEPVQDVSDKKIHFMNITEASIQGLEIVFDWRWPFIPVKNRIGYSYFNPRDLTAKRVLSYRHESSLVISEQFFISDYLTCGLDYRYLSKMRRVQLFDENTKTGADLRVPIHLFSGFIQLTINKSLFATLSVENLFQYYYVVVERNMGPVRHIKLNLNYSF